MHSFIIQLSDAPIEEGDRIDVFDLCEDRLLPIRADYWGDDREEDRKQAIEGIREMLADIAEASGDGVITFDESPETKRRAQDAYTEWFRNQLDPWLEHDEPYEEARWLRGNLENFRGCDYIFAMCQKNDICISGPCCINSVTFVENLLCGDYPKLYVGAILDYHY